MPQPTSPSCAHLYKTYTRYQKAIAEFSQSLVSAQASGDFSEAHTLKAEILQLQENLEPYRSTILEATIRVPVFDNEGNPKKDASGNPETKEKSVRIDFKQELARQITWYQENGLPEYAEALTGVRFRLSKEQKESYIREIEEKNQEPRINFFPGRETQERVWDKLIRLVSPPEAESPNDSEEEKERKKRQRALYPSGIQTNFKKGEKLSIPEGTVRDKPYLLLTFDDPAVLKEQEYSTKNKTRDKHQGKPGASTIFDEYNKKVRTPSNLPPIRFPTLQEMLVLMRQASERALERKRKALNKEQWLPTTKEEHNECHRYQEWSNKRGATWVEGYYKEEGGKKRPVLVCWFPGDSQVGVHWIHPGLRRSSVGARPVVIAKNTSVS